MPMSHFDYLVEAAAATAVHVSIFSSFPCERDSLRSGGRMTLEVERLNYVLHRLTVKSVKVPLIV